VDASDALHDDARGMYIDVFSHQWSNPLVAGRHCENALRTDLCGRSSMRLRRLNAQIGLLKMESVFVDSVFWDSL
jgi:hypothetical protein